jgi:hypothetical protein
MENGMEALSSKLGVSMENQTTTFFGLPVIIGLVNERKENIKLQIDLLLHQISVLGYICLPLVAKKGTHGDKRTWLPHP